MCVGVSCITPLVTNSIGDCELLTVTYCLILKVNQERHPVIAIDMHRKIKVATFLFFEQLGIIAEQWNGLFALVFSVVHSVDVHLKVESGNHSSPP